MAVPVVEIDDVDWTEVKRPNPHFFKVLGGDFTQRMGKYFSYLLIAESRVTVIHADHGEKIPPNFVKNLQADMTTKSSSSSDPLIMTACIEGPTGQTWYAELEKTASGVFFTTGWSKFATDHSLKEHELLIIQYNGCLSFTVLIFDKTACEKEDWDGGSVNGGRKAQLKPIKLAFGQDELGDQLKEKSVSSSEPKITDSETQDEEMNIVDTSTRKHKKASERSKSSPVTEKEKLKAQEAAHSFASENPFFVIRLKASHVYSSWRRLRFPVKFSRKYMPRSKTEFILRVTANSKTWSTAFVPHISERERLSRGWSSFVCDNSLEEEDYCAFELVKSSEFLIHIFRVSKIQMGAASRARKNAKA